MKKIPTLFEREYAGHKVVGVKDTVTPGMEWVLDGEGEATVKIDGACCDPDPVTGHWPHWVPTSRDNPGDKWFIRALDNTPYLENRTYEAIGPHFQGNPYGLPDDVLVPHGAEVIEVARTFGDIRDYLEHYNIEGIVFWKDGEPQCKIKRSDFGFPWPVKVEKEDGV